MPILFEQLSQPRQGGGLAGSAPEQAAFGEGAHGTVDLAVIARKRGEEAVDARSHVREDVVGGEETDGAATHLTAEAFEEDRRRDVVHSMLGFRTLRFTWRQVVYEPRFVAKAIATALAG